MAAEPEPVYLIGPALTIALLVGARVRRSASADDGAEMVVGEPLYEREGVLARRGCISARWTGAEAARVAMALVALGITGLTFRDDFPTNWRRSLI